MGSCAEALACCLDYVVGIVTRHTEHHVLLLLCICGWVVVDDSIT